MKNVLITGATGFLGSHILKKMVNEGDYTIYLLKRKSSSLRRISDYINSNVKIFDIGDDALWYEKFFTENKIDIIIHTATAYGRNHSLPTDILNTNLIFPLTILQEAIKHDVKLFINTDSYFNKPNQSYKTLLDYSLSKKSLNIWLEYLSNNIRIVNLRLEHIFGDDDNPDKFVEKIIQDIAINRIEKLPLTYGQQKRDFVYVDDVCNAYLRIIDNYEKHYFNYLTAEVGTGKSISIFDFVSYVKEYSNSNTKLDFGSIPYREDEIMCSVADNSVLLDWGWAPEFDYKSGVRNIIDIYRGNNGK